MTVLHRPFASSNRTQRPSGLSPGHSASAIALFTITEGGVPPLPEGKPVPAMMRVPVVTKYSGDTAQYIPMGFGCATVSASG